MAAVSVKCNVVQEIVSSLSRSGNTFIPKMATKVLWVLNVKWVTSSFKDRSRNAENHTINKNN